MALPQRIRSAAIVLIYQKTKLSEKILDHLKEQFGIEKDNDWKYILRLEQTVHNETNVLVFIHCAFKPDVYSSKLAIQTEDGLISPLVYCWSEIDFFLRVVLTFYQKIDWSLLLTNFSKEEIQEKAIICQGNDLVVEVVKPKLPSMTSFQSGSLTEK